ncbi:hypothetical protein [Nocardia sp. NPDC052566]|uniref:PPE domain-containing protein n=1 Tax=Nocardia sp. NPDC052566 TaxID=3364330 RepID=UPI0037C9BE42
MRKMRRTTERGTTQLVDAEYAPNVEVFDNMSHAEIHQGVQQLNPAELTAGQQIWHGSSNALAEAVELAHTEIRATVADGWRGAAAESAAAVVRDFERSGQRIADVMAVVAQRLGQAGDAAEALRGAVPAPSTASPDLDAALLDPAQATANTDTQKALESARQDAVRAMDTIYTAAFIPTGSGVPAFPDDVAAVAGAAPDSRTAPGAPAAQPVSMPPAEPGTPAPDFVLGGRPATYQPQTPPVTTVSAVTDPVAAASGGDPAPAPDRVAPAAAAPAAVTSPAPQQVSPATTVAPSAPAAPATPASVPVVTAAATPPLTTAPGSGAPATSDDKRKRDERREDSGNSAVAGMGAGAVGGMMGGAIAAAEAPRSGTSVAAQAMSSRPPQAHPLDEDDDLHFIDDDLTFLEPAADNDLVGTMDPTTPPVLGAWVELE